MAQLGEPVYTGDFISAIEHDESTCPWHQKGEEAVTEMEAQCPDEDNDAMPANLGTRLGANMGARARDEILIAFRAGKVVPYGSGKKQKVVQTYENIEFEEVEYDLQYAPHHLVPGNESLKGSSVVPYLGSDDVIKNFKGGLSSKIKPKRSVGYDVNCAENGVWLPSPYAVSNANGWPAADGIKALIRIKGQIVAQLAEDFKDAYVAAAIDKSGDQQFHMRHSGYSKKVREILDAVGDKIRLMAGGACPKAKESKEDNKFDPPYGLKGRLNLLSSNLRNLTKGLWRAPLFTDDQLITRYIANEKIASVASKGAIEKIL